MELNPCPFCGGTVSIEKMYLNGEPSGLRAIKCGKMDPLCLLDIGALVMPGTPEMMADSWNNWTEKQSCGA